jgi:hypothetical protein
MPSSAIIADFLENKESDEGSFPILVTPEVTSADCTDDDDNPYIVIHEGKIADEIDYVARDPEDSQTINEHQIRQDDTSKKFEAPVARILISGSDSDNRGKLKSDTSF